MNLNLILLVVVASAGPVFSLKITKLQYAVSNLIKNDYELYRDSCFTELTDVNFDTSLTYNGTDQKANIRSDKVVISYCDTLKNLASDNLYITPSGYETNNNMNPGNIEFGFEFTNYIIVYPENVSIVGENFKLNPDYVALYINMVNSVNVSMIIDEHGCLIESIIPTELYSQGANATYSVNNQPEGIFQEAYDWMLTSDGQKQLVKPISWTYQEMIVKFVHQVLNQHFYCDLKEL